MDQFQCSNSVLLRCHLSILSNQALVKRQIFVCILLFLTFLIPSFQQYNCSLTSLVDAMVLMKDIEIDPQDIVTPDLIEEITQDIMSSMANVNFKQVIWIEFSKN